MKKIIFFVLLCFSVFSSEKVIFVTGEFFPYSSESLKSRGCFVELIEEAAKRLDMEIEIKFYSWKRCEGLLKTGQAFATFPYRITEERNKAFYFSQPLIKSTGKFFYLKEKLKNPKWSDYKSLKKFTLGGTLGYWYEKDFSDSGLNVGYSISDEISLKKLYLGKTDILAIDELVGWGLIKKDYPEEIEKFATMEKNLNESDLHLMISRTYPNSVELKDKFDKAIKQLIDDGTFKKIINKYIKNP